MRERGAGARCPPPGGTRAPQSVSLPERGAAHDAPEDKGESPLLLRAVANLEGLHLRHAV